jgi:hypothetical protein
MPWRCPKCVALAILLASAGTARGADALIGSVYDTHFDGNFYALGGSLAWQHTFTGGGWLAGYSNTGYPIGTLNEGDVDVYRTFRGPITLNAGLSLGEATTVTRSSTLYKARTSVDVSVNPTWTAHAGVQYVDLYLIHGNLITASLECRLTQAWMVKAGAGVDANGTVGARYGTFEIDWLRRERLYAGIVLGRTGYDPAHLGDTTFEERLLEIYAGAALPISTATLTVGLDTLSLEGVPRQTLRIGLVEPIP